MRKSSGFSLIELMISLVILAMLLSTATMAYQLLLTRWQKGLDKFELSYQTYRGNELIQSVFSGIYPYVVTDQSGRPSFFFIGKDDSLLAVTRNGLFSEEHPEVFRISLVKKADQYYQLVYQSTSINNYLLLKTDQEIEFEHQIVLLDHLVSASFRYFGLESLVQATSAPVPSMQWFHTFSGIDNQLIPRYTELALISAVGESQLLGRHNSESFGELSSYFESY
ncbi:type II secretion system protein J [Pseudoalteromonas sp. MMG012]|uniref:PulJ/GspJ family protein n=1 Tax=Pseudoalteromonas sp. MMG012 TaxID=2822686 RepID=UPI001B3A485B|nr:prepilin-type N-terminal cleavage/methylation domain-containing protein [Pseudoalteromonas sp. MMG012]MBQ4849240.1 prepilin-type N-terminal cleavage/methylation domain-containing protein [Pseudoalteromonas sp. MMG012]